MDSEEYRQILAMLGTDTDLFKNGIDACCIIQTNAGCYKQAVKELRSIAKGYQSNVRPQLLVHDMAVSTRNILDTGYRMASITAKLYVRAIA